MERNPVGPIKLDHLQRCPNIRSDQTEIIRSIWCLSEISAILGWMNGKRPTVPYDDLWSHVTGSGSLLNELKFVKTLILFCKNKGSLKHELAFTTNFHFNSMFYGSLHNFPNHDKHEPMRQEVLFCLRSQQPSQKGRSNGRTQMVRYLRGSFWNHS